MVIFLAVTPQEVLQKRPTQASPLPKEQRERQQPRNPIQTDFAREIGKMKRGDYLIHIFIEQARQLKCPEGATCDPIIECSVLNERKFTTAKDDIGGGTALCTWNEHLFFEPRNVVGAVEHTNYLERGGYRASQDQHPCP